MTLRSLFAKRVTIYKKRDRETWLQIKKLFKESSFEGMRSGHYLQETVMGGGCGAKLDPRDFGRNGRIDRDIYWIEVPEEKEKEAKELLLRNGIVPVIEDKILLDAALRKKPES